MITRRPAVAGTFYAGDRDTCLRDVLDCLNRAVPVSAGPERPVGGIVPHAGWRFSGKTAAAVFKYLAEHVTPQTIVLPSSVHVRGVNRPMTMAEGEWETPLGMIDLDTELARAIVAKGQVIDEPAAHTTEHAVEVEVPFIQHFWPEAKLVPLSVPPDTSSTLVGRDIAGAIQETGRDALVICSVDLTHYGPNYRFTPYGVGRPAYDVVTKQNDPRLIDMMSQLRADEVVLECQFNHTSCGAGAIAATLAAAKMLGSQGGTLVEYTTSHEEFPQTAEPMSFVGYVGMVL